MHKLTLNDEEYVVQDFDTAIMLIEGDFGYEGEAWNLVVNSNSFDELVNFLEDDGFDVEYEVEKIYKMEGNTVIPLPDSE